MKETRLHTLADLALRNELTPAGREELDNWIGENPAHYAQYLELCEMLGAGSAMLEDVNPDTDNEWERLRRTIEVGAAPSRSRQIFGIWAAAAAVILLLATAWVLLPFNREKSGGPSEFQTMAGKQKEVPLSDGTKIILNGGASLSVLPGFGTEHRKVQLSGEAYFEVARLAQLPFEVESGSTRVTVLGTKFNLRCLGPSDPHRLSVLEGKVQFEAGGRGQRLVLVGDESAVYDPQTGRIEIEQANADEESSWRNRQLVFRNTSFPSAALRLQAFYGVTIRFPDRLNQARLTANFDRKPLSEVLDVLGAVFSVKARQTGRLVELVD